eukprot:TRINITY_DN613_c0_g1_i2.p1 TRINITY_DN613_c0_g1~~TRINITY_DN613_c0_g1_i2.p1  ORF type:complete len:300 (-),score=72.20 TRINITY_DN613_c0_g1_i2:48-947(-)
MTEGRANHHHHYRHRRHQQYDGHHIHLHHDSMRTRRRHTNVDKAKGTKMMMMVSPSLCHDYLTTPTPRKGFSGANADGNENRIMPCEPKTASSPAPRQIVAGQSMPVEWTNGHNTGMYHLEIAPASQDTSVSNFKRLFSAPGAATKPQGTILTIPDDTTPGYHTLRFYWNSTLGQWDNCVDLLVIASGSKAGDGSTLSPVDNHLLQPGEYLLMSGSTPIGVYNVNTGSVTCIGGYKADGLRCVVSGLAPGAAFAVALVIILLIVGVVVGALIYIKRKKPLLWYGITTKAGDIKKKITGK